MDAAVPLQQNTTQPEQQLPQLLLDQKLQHLKSLNLYDSVVNFWVCNVNTRNKNKRFSNIKRLQLHDDAKSLFRGYVTDCIAGNEHISELRHVTTNQDNRFFYIESDATDLSQASSTILTDDIRTITNKDELNEFNSYVIQLTLSDGENIFAFRYISGSWSVNSASGKFFGFELSNNSLIVKVSQDFKFQVTPYIDFIQHSDDVFIADVKQFETAMNYHERLKEKKNEAIAAMYSDDLMVTSSKGTLEKVIGNDKFLMRQLAAVHQKSYYTNNAWLAQLKIAAETAGNWKIQFDENGKIVVHDNKEYVKELLILLQNKRVKTVVDGYVYDVDGELIAVNTTSDV
ncbi:Uncharacterised protein [Aeromonas salmonicida]|uniref:Kiwa anti-phage protein KwaB-like domain-containing protein n=1 Tax=Aeromonas salmonicida TaxID=645 RepID=UPI00102710F1|nr:Kiwa anti-phage protein KwaB-like domain-containing protein [Aeromonas salmonicida]VFB09263.1 Uncharacterised protein [Aeromonas salmonicida]